MHAGLIHLPPPSSDETVVLNLNQFMRSAPEDRKINVDHKAIQETVWTVTVIGLCVAAWFAACAMGFFAFFLGDSFYHYLSGS